MNKRVIDNPEALKELKKSFGQRIKELRRSANFTQDELSEMIGITQRQLSRVEQGENFVSANMLAKLSIALNKDLCDLFSFSWNEIYTCISTGTDNKTQVEVIKECVNKNTSYLYIKSQYTNIHLPENIAVEDTEDSLCEIVKTNEMPLTVRFYKNNEIECIKTYFPSGKIEEVLSKEQLELQELANNLKKKVKSFSQDRQKLQFIMHAIQAAEDGSTIKELKKDIQDLKIASLKVTR